MDGALQMRIQNTKGCSVQLKGCKQNTNTINDIAP